MSDIEMHYRFARHWEENASKETWANKAVAWNIWQEKQAEIDHLKTQLNNMEQCYIGMKKERDTLQEKNENALSKVFNCRVIGADRIHACDVVEKALRGES